MGKRNILWAVAGPLLLASWLYAETTVVTRQVKGIGKTRQEAIRHALAEAVGQVQGVVVKSATAESALVVGNLDVTRQEGKKSIELEGIAARGTDTITLTQAQGLVKTYEVLEEKTTADGHVELLLSVSVYDYASPLKDQKTPIAVSAFETTAPNSVFMTLIVPAEQVSRQFSDALTRQLAASGRFTLLERAYDKAFAKEKAIWKSDDAGLEEKAKLGNVQGAEYLLAGTITRAAIVYRPLTIAATGQNENLLEGHFVAEARLFAAATRQITHTTTVRLKLEHNDVKKLVDKWEAEKVDPDQLREKLFELAARQMVEDILEALYPLRIASVDPLIVDQGAGRVNAGDLYRLTAQDQTIKDPVTGEVLGQTEKAVGVLRIEQVLPRFAYATLVEGEPSAVQVGQICRYVRPVFDQESPAATEGRKAKHTTTPSGGVMMPFDKPRSE